MFSESANKQRIIADMFREFSTGLRGTFIDSYADRALIRHVQEAEAQARNTFGLHPGRIPLIFLVSAKSIATNWDLTMTEGAIQLAAVGVKTRNEILVNLAFVKLWRHQKFAQNPNLPPWISAEEVAKYLFNGDTLTQLPYQRIEQYFERVAYKGILTQFSAEDFPTALEEAEA